MPSMKIKVVLKSIMFKKKKSTVKHTLKKILFITIYKCITYQLYLILFKDNRAS